ncbi:MAG TPA: hypothetical protein PLC42_01045 [Parachlamydiaceae bacterium]|nr:hypothetical protein [Parachlamydiaceae bacterium]
MKLTLSEVKQKYLDLIADKISREEVSNWAFLLMQQNDLNNLTYVPSESKDKILSALIFLCKTDVQERPGKYFFYKEDIQDEFKELFEYK